MLIASINCVKPVALKFLLVVELVNTTRLVNQAIQENSSFSFIHLSGSRAGTRRTVRIIGWKDTTNFEAQEKDFDRTSNYNITRIWPEQIIITPLDEEELDQPEQSITKSKTLKPIEISKPAKPKQKTKIPNKQLDKFEEEDEFQLLLDQTKELSPSPPLKRLKKKKFNNDFLVGQEAVKRYLRLNWKKKME